MEPSKSSTVLHFPDWRGGNYYQQNLADGLKAQGIRVCFPEHTGFVLPLFRNIRLSGASVLHLHWIAAINGAEQKSRFRMLLQCLMFILDLSLLKWKGIPIIWTVHNLSSHDTRYPRADLWSRRFLAARCQTIIAHSRAAAADIAFQYRVSEAKISVIPHGNYHSNYPSDLSRSQSRQKLNLPENAQIFLFFGNMKPYKGIEDLISAFLKTAQSDSLLLIAGKCSDSNYLRSLQNAAREDRRIRFDARFIPDNEVQAYLKAANVCVFPFKNIFTSGSLILAAGFGLAIIAPNLPTLREYLHPEGAELFDPLKESDSLEKCLSALIGRDTDLMGRRNREVIDRFDWQTIGGMVAKTYVHG